MSVIDASEGMQVYADLLKEDVGVIRKKLKKHPNVMLIRKETFGTYKIFLKLDDSGELSIVDFYDSSKGKIGKEFDVFLLELGELGEIPVDQLMEFYHRIECLTDSFLTGLISRTIYLSRTKRTLVDFGVSDSGVDFVFKKNVFIDVIDKHTSIDYLIESANYC